MVEQATLPAVSVVIPVLNGERFLGEQLAALSEQQVEGGFEVLVCDNGSTDGSVALARGFGDRLRLRVVDASARRGQTYARNLGATLASAPSLVFLDQDDVVMPGYLDAMRAALTTNEIVASRVECERLNPGWVGKVRQVAQTVALPRDPRPWGYGCTLGVRKGLFERLGGFDIGFRVAAEDVDLCWRAAALGAEVAFVPEAILCYRFRDSLRALFRDGRRYGLGGVAVSRKHGLVAEHPREWLVRTAGALRRLLVGPDLGTRGQGAFLLGRRLGILEGAIRRRGRAR
jgi:GT2 family glycosyltransferase